MQALDKAFQRLSPGLPSQVIQVLSLEAIDNDNKRDLVPLREPILANRLCNLFTIDS
jgi:hypothetical protein